MSDDEQLDLGDFLAPGDEPDDSTAALRGFLGIHDEREVDYARPYAAVAEDMWRAGWHAVLPLPPGKKSSPPTGWTGDAPYPSYPDVFAWIETNARGNVAVRMPDIVVGIDVDCYGIKRGDLTLAELEAKWGALPATWRSTSRGVDNPGGIRFYRVPAGTYFVGGFEAIEVIQAGHRYAVVWPSTNPDAGGARYEWIDPSGAVASRFPKVDELPALPEAWLAGMRSDRERVKATALVPDEVFAWLAELRPDKMCGEVHNTLRKHLDLITSPRGTTSRHDLTMRATRQIIALGGEGHALGDLQARDAAARYPTTSPVWRIDALRELGRAFVRAVTAPGKGGMKRELGDAVYEYESLCVGAVRVAATKNPRPELHDPSCMQWDADVAWAGPIVKAPRPALDPFNTPAAKANPAGAPLMRCTEPHEHVAHEWVERTVVDKWMQSELSYWCSGEGTLMTMLDDKAPPAGRPEATDPARETRRPSGATGDADHEDTAAAAGDNGHSDDPGADSADTYVSTQRKVKVARPIDATFTDARLAERVAAEVLDGRFCWTGALGWLAWNGKVWQEIEQPIVVDAVREHFLDWFSREVHAGATAEMRKLLAGLLSAGRIGAITGLSRGLVVRDAAEFDADPYLLNCDNGVVDLRTKRLMPHHPGRSMRKITKVAYEPGKTHPDFSAALRCLPDDVIDWYQVRLGQAVTGFMTDDDVLVVAQGGGKNGKSTLHGVVSAVLGSYFVLVSDRVLMANPDAHPTEMMDLMGARFALVEETPEARHLNVNRLKKTVGTPEITARRIRQDSVTFAATHSLFLSTNYRPIVAETDWGTWRRLRLVRFPYTFVKAGAELAGGQRHGDASLRERLLASARHNGPAARAALAWLIDGAAAWFAAEQVMPDDPATIENDTLAWRAETDQVLSYVGERLVFDPLGVVLATDLLADVNQWLVSANAKPWGERVAAQRFADHEAFVNHNVTKGKQRVKIDSLSRTPNVTGDWIGQQSTLGYRPEVPPVAACWSGIRFKGSADQQLELPSEQDVPDVPGASD